LGLAVKLIAKGIGEFEFPDEVEEKVKGIMARIKSEAPFKLVMGSKMLTDAEISVIYRLI